ncbi:Glutamine amidotransferase-like class 1 domain-containing protein 1 [Blyttiomyces sp. JEL0837]|nr:Glutamine amidotransferase-like class 1 domain-containing protein 1 [Blyttiomyces sp. JEL0837]
MLLFNSTHTTGSAGSVALAMLSDPFDARELELEGELDSFVGLVVPDGEGSLYNDECPQIGRMIEHFRSRRSSGLGTLFTTRPESYTDTWKFNGYSMTGPTNMELVSTGTILDKPSIEDFVTIWGGKFSSGRDKHACHVVVDDTLVTGQNRISTMIAIQNFILIARRHVAAAGSG